MSKSLNFKDVVGRLFRRGDEKDDEPGSGAAFQSTSQHGPPASQGARTPRQIADSLRNLIQSRGEARVGHLQIIGLSKFRHIFGADWPQMEEKAWAITASVIEHHLVKGDIYTRYGEDQYLILFASLMECEAQIKCALIAREISRRLIGDGATASAVEIKTAVAIVGPDLKFESVDPEKILKTAIGKAVPPAPIDPPPEMPKPDTAASGAPAGDPLARIPIAHVYRPIWFVKRKIISSYVCTPSRATAPAGICYGYHVLPGGEKSTLVSEIDCATIAKIAADLITRPADAAMPILGMAVHYETLARSATRTRFFDIYKSVPEAARKAVVFEIVAAPADVAPSRLYEIVSLLKPACRVVLLRVSLDYLDLGRFRGQPVHAVGAEVSNDHREEGKVVHELGYFAERVRRRGFRTYVHGLNSLGLTMAAVYAGFDYIDGDTVTSIGSSVSGVQPFEMENLQRPLLDNGGLGWDQTPHYIE